MELPKEKIEEISLKYQEIIPRYRKLGLNLQQVLEDLLDSEKIEYLYVKHRIKDLISFKEKIERKDYDNPFEQTEDLCGLRIVCFQFSDLAKIETIIKNEFQVLDSINKSALIEPDRFGYRSIHYVIKLKDEWLKAPNYRNLGNVKAEIQIRTILMHAWADVEHKLAYKKSEDVPAPLKRRLSQLSALFEIADDQLESLQIERQKYSESLVDKKDDEKGRFDTTQPLNFDSLQTFLNFYFFDRPSDKRKTSELLSELIENKISFSEILTGYQKIKPYLNEIESRNFNTAIPENKKEHFYQQVGIIRTILDLTSDKYLQFRRNTFPSYVEKIKSDRAKFEALKNKKTEANHNQS